MLFNSIRRTCVPLSGIQVVYTSARTSVILHSYCCTRYSDTLQCVPKTRPLLILRQVWQFMRQLFAIRHKNYIHIMALCVLLVSQAKC